MNDLTKEEILFIKNLYSLFKTSNELSTENNINVLETDKNSLEETNKPSKDVTYNYYEPRPKKSIYVFKDGIFYKEEKKSIKDIAVEYDLTVGCINTSLHKGFVHNGYYFSYINEYKPVEKLIRGKKYNNTNVENEHIIEKIPVIKEETIYDRINKEKYGWKWLHIFYDTVKKDIVYYYFSNNELITDIKGVRESKNKDVKHVLISVNRITFINNFSKETIETFL